MTDKQKEEIRNLLKRRSPDFLKNLINEMKQESKDSIKRKQHYDNINRNSRLHNISKS